MSRLSSYARFLEPADEPLPDYSRVEFWHVIEEISIGQGYFTARVKIEGDDEGGWNADETWFQVHVNNGTADDDFESLGAGNMDRWFRIVIKAEVEKEKQAISERVHEQWSSAR